MGMYDVGCAVSADLNRYMHRLAAEDRRDNAIEAREQELMKPGEECDPHDIHNLAEALTEGDQTKLGLIAKRLAEGDTAAAGLILDGMTTSYWKHMARKQAERQITDAACQRCYDAGCRFCEGDE